MHVSSKFTRTDKRLLDESRETQVIGYPRHALREIQRPTARGPARGLPELVCPSGFSGRGARQSVGVDARDRSQRPLGTARSAAHAPSRASASRTVKGPCTFRLNIY